MSIPIITPIIYPSAEEFWKGGLPTFYGYAYNNRVLTNLPAKYKVSSMAAQSAADRL